MGPWIRQEDGSSWLDPVVMTRTDEQYTCSPSTKWEWRLCRVAAGPAPAGDSRSQSVHSRSRRSRDAYLPLTIQVRFRGGSEASWLIQYRGLAKRFPGHLALHDVLAELSSAKYS